MVTRKEDTARRQSRRKYEEKNKEQRKETNSIQTMIPRELYEEISSFLKEIGMTKVQFIKEGYQYLKGKHKK